jgi:acyl-CoA reductase-like NAD-dependent aldehyde dehydrogenase
MGTQPGQAQVAEKGGQVPSSAMDSQEGLAGAIDAGNVEEQLRQLGMTYADWARLPGELRNQVLQAAADDVPEEYRQLVVRYFREISRRSAEAEAGGNK